ncbi:hypothetical protein [Streptomyces californicus]|uniref:hypothetical protein n=1 Tax=Streptomyces californicus TaxID=67351 RepID=UPI00296E375F|nr:hypothetical protein [Streptomyces californicus]MDW4916291.1 hypothetical protein [Streptomyces californicus]
MSHAVSNQTEIADDLGVDVRSGCLDRAMSDRTGGPVPHLRRDRPLLCCRWVTGACRAQPTARSALGSPR